MINESKIYEVVNEDTLKDFVFVDLGDAAEITMQFADGGSKDGGHIPGHNWAYN